MLMIKNYREKYHSVRVDKKLCQKIKRKIVNECNLIEFFNASMQLYLTDTFYQNLLEKYINENK